MRTYYIQRTRDYSGLRYDAVTRPWRDAAGRPVDIIATVRASSSQAALDAAEELIQADGAKQEGEAMTTIEREVKTDCCGHIDRYLIADAYGNGRVAVEGTCPICGTTDPRGSLITRQEG